MSVILRRKVNKIDEGNTSKREEEIFSELESELKKYKFTAYKNIHLNQINIENTKLSDSKINGKFSADMIFQKSDKSMIIIVEEISANHFDIFNNLHKTENSMSAAGYKNANKFIFKLYDIIRLFWHQVKIDYRKYKFYKSLTSNNKHINVYYVLPNYFDENNYKDKNIDSDISLPKYEIEYVEIKRKPPKNLLESLLNE